MMITGDHNGVLPGVPYGTMPRVPNKDMGE